ncbi:hypothetical protein [Bernardetia sp. MNP-M8]|uniref:tetratricopeptide repeat protein n=1 Tax=Bernardetia sp. MNP-M8 TaxID=3127470 RepID=UPI0030CA6B1B
MDTTSIVLSIILFIFIGIPSILFLNQISRALVGSLFTNENIELYFGSLPSEEESFKVKISRFKLFFVKNYFWFQGSCRFIDTRFLSIQKKIIQIGSTFITFLISLGLYYLTDEYNFHQIIKVASILLFVASCLNILFSLTQQDDFIEDIIGTTMKNYIYSETDEEQLSDINEELTALFHQGVDYFNNAEYEKAIVPLQELVDRTHKNPLIIDVLFQSYLMSKKYIEAEEFVDYLEKNHKLTSNHYCNFGLAKSYTQKYQECFHYYKKSLELDKKNTFTLNNRGYTYNLVEKYEEAILDFDAAIHLDSAFSHSYNNRGLAKIKLGRTEEGLKDIQTSMKLDDKNSYAYRNLGIYHFEKKQYKIALSYFEKSYQLDKTTHLIEENIKETKSILKKLEEN